MFWQFSHFASTPADKYPKLNSEAVDLPLFAATCNPAALVPDCLFAAFSDTKALFGDGSSSLSRSACFHASGRDEYIKLTLRHLECGKVRLRVKVEAVGDVFCVAKAKGRQREVWNGPNISDNVSPPPAPRLLANPDCFVDLYFPPGSEIYMSRRDVRTCFDVLQDPENIQEHFGRPPLT